jgi:hypothetical protein
MPGAFPLKAAILAKKLSAENDLLTDYVIADITLFVTKLLLFVPVALKLWYFGTYTF